jgi:methylated-DNA-[protein]-cysteine S-methyltransferase
MTRGTGTQHAEEQRLVIGSPLGLLELVARGDALEQLRFSEKGGVEDKPAGHSLLLAECRRQLEEYFSGKRRQFDFSLDPQGTAFEKEVWQRLKRIPYGRTASYKEIAQDIGRPRAVRAVGAANGKNPLAIIVPCHRVVGHHGSLTGYGGGLWRKQWLLDHERRNMRA